MEGQCVYPVADLGEGPGGPGPPLFWVKKEEMTELGKMAAMASKSSKTVVLGAFG